MKKDILFEVIVAFSYFFRFFYVHSMLRTYFMKKGFTSVSLLPFTKKLGRSSYDITMNHYDVIWILLLFRVVPNGTYSGTIFLL